eukprot:m.47762 g.47762  ORF g.47762 m.47762 type:complete len:145 (-) comp7357_c1_seq1:1398-1832(-)
MITNNRFDFFFFISFGLNNYRIIEIANENKNKILLLFSYFISKSFIHCYSSFLVDCGVANAHWATKFTATKRHATPTNTPNSNTPDAVDMVMVATVGDMSVIGECERSASPYTTVKLDGTTFAISLRSDMAADLLSGVTVLEDK